MLPERKRFRPSSHFSILTGARLDYKKKSWIRHRSQFSCRACRSEPHHSPLRFSPDGTICCSHGRKSMVSVPTATSPLRFSLKRGEMNAWCLMSSRRDSNARCHLETIGSRPWLQLAAALRLKASHLSKPSAYARGSNLPPRCG